MCIYLIYSYHILYKYIYILYILFDFIAVFSDVSQNILRADFLRLPMIGSSFVRRPVFTLK